MLDRNSLPSRDHDVGRVARGLEIDLELDTGEVRGVAVPVDRERASRELVVEDRAVLEDLECL